MSGPWEDYQPQEAPPWELYGAQKPAEPPYEGSRKRAQQASANILSDSLQAVVPGIARSFNGITQTLGNLVSRLAPDVPAYQQQRQQLADVIASQDKANAGIPGYGAGRFAGDVAFTAPVGGALAAPLRPLVGAIAPKALPIVEAIASGGMKTGATPSTFAGRVGDLGARALGGGVTGAASAAAVDPDAATAGGVIGAALPVGLKAVGGAARLAGAITKTTGSELVNAFKSDTTRGAQELMKALDLTPEQLPDLIKTLRSAPELVAGSIPTVAQSLSMPQASILERLVSAGPGGEKLRQAIVAQSEARMNALGGVAPIAPNGFSQMRADTGTAIGNFAKAERAQAATANRAQYQGIDPNNTARISLPAQDMQNIADRFVGPGSVGDNTIPQSFATEAASLSKAAPSSPPSLILGPNGAPMIPGGPPVPRMSSWDEVLRMRSSLNEQWSKAKNAGDNQAAAALDAQKKALDEAINAQLPPEVKARWQEANASRADIGQRFDSGPQAQIFQTRNGEPARQGGEITSLFWGNRPGLAEDVNSFKKLVGDNPNMLGQFKSLITTEGASTAAQGGVLGQKYVQWVNNVLPGLRNVMSESETKTLQNIAADIERANAAAKMGGTIGGGSSTYQNVANALDAGLMGSPLAKMVAPRIPFLRAIAEPARAAMAESAVKAKGARLAGLLADSNAAAEALQGQVRSPAGKMAKGLLDMGDNAWNAAIPGLGLTPKELGLLGIYRSAPLISAQ